MAKKEIFLEWVSEREREGERERERKEEKVMETNVYWRGEYTTLMSNRKDYVSMQTYKTADTTKHMDNYTKISLWFT